VWERAVVEPQFLEDGHTALANVRAGCVEERWEVEAGALAESIRCELRVELGAHWTGRSHVGDLEVSASGGRRSERSHFEQGGICSWEKSTRMVHQINGGQDERENAIQQQ
jgi:hypothetical protein